MKLKTKQLLKGVIVLVCLFSIFSCSAQFKVSYPGKNALPAGLHYPGQIIESANWKDKLGDNIVIMTETQRKQGAGENGGDDKELHAYHYFVTADSIAQTWKLYDYIKDCPVDIKAEFLKNTFQVTDLNKDGIAEIWIIYETVCRGDVSPGDIKIIMHEGSRKYALRGKSRVHVSKNETIGGDYVLDASFKEGDKLFREQAIQLWEKNADEQWK